MVKVCENCVYYNQGSCRINPPVVLMHGSTPATYWPTVQANDWCAKGYNTTDGHYDPRP